MLQGCENMHEDRKDKQLHFGTSEKQIINIGEDDPNIGIEFPNEDQN